MKPKNQEDISTDWELNEGWGEDNLPEWDIQIPDWNIDLPEWEIDISSWEIQLPDWDSLLSEGWNNATDKTDNRKQAESLDNAE